MDKKKHLTSLKKKMIQDESLPLRKTASNLVFGEGDPCGEIMFIGEGPGYWEDQKARPFVGNAGAFLNHLLQSIKLPRDKVFITNIIHYRPPNNRDPLPDEIEAFRPYLDKMIGIIRPKMIVTLGRYSMAKFIPGVIISTVHGKPQAVDWKGEKIIIVPMYHPAAGLRSTEIKRKTIDDFRILPEVLKNSMVRKKKEVEQMSLV